MKKLLIIIIFSINLHSADQLISSAGVEYLTCGSYKIKGQLGRDKKSSTFYVNVYPKTKRQYKVILNGNIPSNFDRYVDKVHIIASGDIKKAGRGSNTILYLTEKLEVLNPNEKFQNVIIKTKNSPCNK
jgi:hypothetical protein